MQSIVTLQDLIARTLQCFQRFRRVSCLTMTRIIHGDQCTSRNSKVRNFHWISKTSSLFPHFQQAGLSTFGEDPDTTPVLSYWMSIFVTFFTSLMLVLAQQSWIFIWHTEEQIGGKLLKHTKAGELLVWLLFQKPCHTNCLYVLRLCSGKFLIFRSKPVPINKSSADTHTP